MPSKPPMKKRPAPNPNGLMVISRRDLKQKLRKAFWVAANAASPDLLDNPLDKEERDRLADVFEAHWKATYGG